MEKEYIGNNEIIKENIEYLKLLKEKHQERKGNEEYPKDIIKFEKKLDKAIEKEAKQNEKLINKPLENEISKEEKKAKINSLLVENVSNFKKEREEFNKTLLNDGKPLWRE